MNILLTKDFNDELYQILKDYSDKEFNLMIAGGSLLKCLVDPRLKDLVTDKWKVFFADERVDQKYLNYNDASGFLSQLKGTVFRIKSELSASECVKDYTNVLENIDLCLLGIGDDGHICSLFPDTASLDSNAPVIAIEEKLPVSNKRITVTLKFINEKVGRLYFVVPAKDGKVKNVLVPHQSILSRLKKDFIVIRPE